MPCFLILFFSLIIVAGAAHAKSPGVTVWGVQGLNTVPNARMDEAGVMRAGVANLDPYAHGFLGFQIADPLYISLRQTAETSNIRDDPDRLYPGLDLKLRLLQESEYAPAIVVGLQSATGHKRAAGEYLALSKRYGAFDFTAGLGWGRYGSAGHFNNPLKGLSSHFGKDRALDGEMPNEPSDWFTGERIGLFGGVEYQTPLKGLSLVFDVGADRYAAESNAFDYNAPAPWALGLRYAPRDWVNVQAGVQGADKIMARVSFQGSPAGWFGKAHKQSDIAPMQAHRTDSPAPDQARLEAEKYEIIMDSVVFDGAHGAANLDLNPHQPAPYQMGRAMRMLANNAGPDVEEIAITPRAYGLRGPQVKLMRKDFEKALALKQGSADEIWKNARFDVEAEGGPRPLMRSHYRPENLRLILDNDISLSEEDSGVLYRSAVIAELDGPTLWNALHTGTSWRLNLKDNLARIDDIRPRSPLPVRSNVGDFTDMTVGMDRMYAALTHSFTPELHGMAAAGYLEEMYGGAGGELLWRPYGKRYALGVESWLALKRDPALALASGFNGDSLLTGHVNGWYEFPDQNLTAYAKIGRFLAEDLGVTAGLAHEFKNGATLDGFITLSDAADFDLFGGTTHAYQGVRFTLPLGNVPYVPEGSVVRVKAAPLGRDTGQALDAPLKLYDMTESFSAGHMAEYWDGVTE